jgi:hypothetical protein
MGSLTVFLCTAGHHQPLTGPELTVDLRDCLAPNGGWKLIEPIQDRHDELCLQQSINTRRARTAGRRRRSQRWMGDQQLAGQP